MTVKLQLLGAGLSFVLGIAAPALAVQPASISANTNVAWSKVVENPFDGKIVYDRNYKDDYVFVSSWSKSGIRVTYTQASSVLIGYEYHYEFGRRRYWGVPYTTPIYQESYTDSIPDSISLAINGKVYTYENGPVSPELAQALTSAPLENIKIRLIWKDGRIKDTEIGKGTVQAWKQIF